jgi:hypothetical protein
MSRISKIVAEFLKLFEFFKLFQFLKLFKKSETITISKIVLYFKTSLQWSIINKI